MNKISNIATFTVTQLNNSIKNLIENNYQIIEVSGEVSQLKKHSSGHIYFTLKDEESVISAICWRSVVPSLKINIEDGLKIIIKGKVTTYSKQSKYQLIVQHIEFHGEGSLLKILEQRKEKLAKMGYFNVLAKKSIPKLPKSIGVITSESGSVIKDIIHRISDRYPLKLIIYPSNVQGDKCLNDIINGIDFFNIENKKKQFVDLIIIARGGGSLEDLMSFNEELLVKRIFESSIPIVSAVGHETDYTLCDLASDLRAPTPSAAAEMVVPHRKDIIVRLNNWSDSIKKSFLNHYDKKKLNFTIVKSKIPNLSDKINNNFQSLDLIESNFLNLINIKLKNTKIQMFEIIKSFSASKLENFLSISNSNLSNSYKKINSLINEILIKKKINLNSNYRELSILSYKETLKRGFAVVRSEEKIVKSDLEIKKNEEFEIEFLNDKTLAKKI